MISHVSVCVLTQGEKGLISSTFCHTKREYSFSVRPIGYTPAFLSKIEATLLKARRTHYSEMFSYSFDSLLASFLWKYPNSNTLMERRASIRFCNFATPSVVGWTSIACCAPSIKREMRKYFQFSIRRSQTLIIIPAEQSRTFIMLRSLSFVPESWRQIQDRIVLHRIIQVHITALYVFCAIKFVKTDDFKGRTVLTFLHMPV